MTVIRRWECPQHGDTLTATTLRAPQRWCIQHGRFIDPVQVEYVPSSAHQGAVAEVELLRQWIAAFGPDTACIDVDAVLAASRERVPPASGGLQ